MLAVSQYRNILFAQFLYGADNLSSENGKFGICSYTGLQMLKNICCCIWVWTGFIGSQNSWCEVGEITENKY